MCQLVSLIGSGSNVGVWLRDGGRQRPLSITAEGRCIEVVIGGDLGALLRCCARVVVRSAAGPLMLHTEMLIRWRALQVVTGTPYLPDVRRLREIFPDAEPAGASFRVSIQDCSPEEVLADCATHRIPVAESRVVYNEGTQHPDCSRLSHEPGKSTDLGDRGQVGQRER